ncbi:Phosphatase PAP2 family protein [Gammaproteobacteria bacterium]
MDIEISLIANHTIEYKLLKWLFVTISRLCDFDFWVTLGCVFFSLGDYRLIVHLVIVGMIGWGISTFLKLYTARDRPYQADSRIRLESIPIDEYSFPSCHVLLSTTFSIIISSYHSELSLMMIIFTFLVSISRLVLGLHYFSDVLAGAIIGLILGTVSI